MIFKLDKLSFEIWLINNKYEVEFGGIEIFVGGSFDIKLIGWVLIIGG